MQQLYTIRDDVSLNFLTYVNQAASFDRGHLRKLLTRHLQREATPEVIRLFREAKRSIDECIEAVPVRTLTFETLLHKHSVRHIDLLQIDTEGFDDKVLAGLNQPIEQLLFEVSSDVPDVAARSFERTASSIRPAAPRRKRATSRPIRITITSTTTPKMIVG